MIGTSARVVSLVKRIHLAGRIDCQRVHGNMLNLTEAVVNGIDPGAGDQAGDMPASIEVAGAEVIAVEHGAVRHIDLRTAVRVGFARMM